MTKEQKCQCPGKVGRALGSFKRFSVSLSNVRVGVCDIIYHICTFICIKYYDYAPICESKGLEFEPMSRIWRVLIFSLDNIVWISRFFLPFSAKAVIEEIWEVRATIGNDNNMVMEKAKVIWVKVKLLHVYGNCWYCLQ